MSGEQILALFVSTDEQGKLHASIQSELPRREAAAVLSAVLADVGEDGDRADRAEAWGADRRRRA